MPCASRRGEREPSVEDSAISGGSANGRSGSRTGPVGIGVCRAPNDTRPRRARAPTRGRAGLPQFVTARVLGKARVRGKTDASCVREGKTGWQREPFGVYEIRIGRQPQEEARKQPPLSCRRSSLISTDSITVSGPPAPLFDVSFDVAPLSAVENASCLSVMVKAEGSWGGGCRVPHALSGAATATHLCAPPLRKGRIRRDSPISRCLRHRTWWA